MADFAFSVLGKLASSALQANSLPWGEIKKFKETMSTIEAVLQHAEESQTNSKLRIKLEDGLLKNASDLLDEIEGEVQLWSQGSAGRKLCRLFSSSNPLVFCFRIGLRIKKMRERFDKILAERDRVDKTEMLVRRDLPAKPKNKMPVRRHVGVPVTPGKLEHGGYQVKEIREWVSEIIARIDKLNDNVTYSFFPASMVLGLDKLRIVACIVAVCVDPFFLYIPFLSHTKMCLGINTELWKVAVALITVADFFTALLLIMSIDRPQLSRCMSSIKSILLMCVKFLALAPIPQILFSEKFILKTLGGYTFWNLILICHYGARLVLIFQASEKLKMRVSNRTLVRSNAPVYLFLYLIVSHVIGASWYYLSIKRLLSCWNYACKNITGCIFPCDGTTPSTLNSTLVSEFCPPNPQKFGIYLDALKSGMVEDKGVLKKFLQCFFWGLRNLSSFASNLHTSRNDGETFFAIIISAVALILLIYLIGNIQRYSELESARSETIADKLESARSERIADKLESARSERLVYKILIKDLIECLVVFHNLDNRTKKSIEEHIQEAFENGFKSFNLERFRINHFLNDVTKTESVLKDLRFLEEWVFNGQLGNLWKAKNWLDDHIPHDQNNIFFYLTCRLRDDEDVNLISVLSVLPDKSKRWITMKDLCYDTLKRVPGLQNIDEECLKSMSSLLKPVIYPKGSYIFRRGEHLEFIIFITNGKARDIKWQEVLSKGDFFGAELITWCLELIKWKPKYNLLGISGSSKSLEKGHFSGVSGSSTLEQGDIFEELVRMHLELDRMLMKYLSLEREKLLFKFPISTADVKCETNVEAFVLRFEDL